MEREVREEAGERRLVAWRAALLDLGSIFTIS